MGLFSLIFFFLHPFLTQMQTLYVELCLEYCSVAELQ